MLTFTFKYVPDVLDAIVVIVTGQHFFLILFLWGMNFIKKCSTSNEKSSISNENCLRY